jgi:hypothetical protein
LDEGIQNRQQHEVIARASREETAIRIKRGNMSGMLETRCGLAMKKTEGIRQAAGGLGF